MKRFRFHIYLALGGTVLKAPVGLKRRPSTVIGPPTGVSNSSVPRFPAVTGYRVTRLNDVWPIAGRVRVCDCNCVPVSSRIITAIFLCAAVVFPPDTPVL